jgi:hypothetical protein
MFQDKDEDVVLVGKFLAVSFRCLATFFLQKLLTFNFSTGPRKNRIEKNGSTIVGIVCEFETNTCGSRKSISKEKYWINRNFNSG